jgi:hypothetical protein
MSDDHTTPDPMDRAYARAEALLDDAAARAARRAQVLDAVAREPVVPAAPPVAARRRFDWRHGGGLAAAGVAGLSVLVAVQINRNHPEPVRPQVPPPAALQAPAAPAPAATSPAPARVPATGPSPAKPAPVRQAPAAPPAAEPQSADIVAAEPSPAFRAPPPPPPAPPVALAAPAARFAPAPPPPAAAAPSTNSIEEMVVVTGEKRGAASAKAARVASPAPLPGDPAARLRTAAALGSTADVEALLAGGAAVDAPDAEGETALMKAVRADKPAVATLLRRHGASLELKNRAGLSAKEIAGTVGDPELNRALGLEP